MLTEQVPRTPLDKGALGKDALILENKLQISRILDQSPWRKCRYRDGNRLVAKLTLALIEPSKEVPPTLEESDAIAYKR